MKTRYLWTLERAGREAKSGLDTLDDLAVALMREDLPGVMPADWIVDSEDYRQGVLRNVE